MFKKYLITGATGFLGRTVVGKLLEKKAEVYALVMENDPLVQQLPDEVIRIFGDVCDSDSLLPLFSYADNQTCVIHCAGIVSVASNPGKKVFHVNVGGTKNIVRLCMDYKVGKMVYISSVHAIPEKPKGTTITEDAQFSPDVVEGDYAKSKAMATAYVLEAAGNGLNASVVFPSGIIGPGDSGQGSITSTLLSFIAGKLPFAMQGGYDFVDVRDVAKGIIGCSKNGLPGHGYILSGHYATISEILETVKEILNLKYKVSYLPIPLARFAAAIYEKWCLRKKKPLFFTPYAVNVLDSNGKFSYKSASETFGYKPRLLKDTLYDTIQWLKATK
ncbi:MAG: SDR family NAD(P)-dependent oxidoreductase [Erysipelotrichaceae bacterium]